MKDLQITLFASFGLLIFSVATLWWLANRAFISPLQADLTQARQQVVAKEGLAQIGAMAAAVVHEIRKPITTIRARTAAQKQARVIEEQIDLCETQTR